MLITFKSSADGDVIMFGDVGQAMLSALGKDPAEPRGIVTVAQLPEAIAALERCIAQDKRAQEALALPPDDDDEAPAAHEVVVHFAQRAVPLLHMLQRSATDQVPVIWQV